MSKQPFLVGGYDLILCLHGRGWKAEACNDSECKNPIHRSRLYLRAHPINPTAFLAWEQSGHKMEDIPEEYAVSW